MALIQNHSKTNLPKVQSYSKLEPLKSFTNNDSNKRNEEVFFI
jgi:hypothetical protein